MCVYQMHQLAPLELVEEVPHLLAGVLNIFFQITEVRFPVTVGAVLSCSCACIPPPLQQHTISKYGENSRRKRTALREIYHLETQFIGQREKIFAGVFAYRNHVLFR